MVDPARPKIIGVRFGRRGTMRATIGDHVVVRGYQFEEEAREGEILEIRGSDGWPPYLVRWCADGCIALVTTSLSVSIEPCSFQIDPTCQRLQAVGVKQAQRL
jgi:hypothetical protein